MALTAPQWLKERSCDLKASANGSSWVVYFGDQPQYTLVLAPAAGRYTCKVTQTINGERLDSGGTFPTPEEAARGGLEDLRKALGW
jgi:hypothetical protein